jgi:LPXTG-site transpeptidase (sortase) family protein
MNHLRSLLLSVFAILALIFFVSLIQQQVQNTTIHSQDKKQILADETRNKNKGFPMRLKIPRINVDAAVEYVGVTSKGSMDVPINTHDVGLFKFGAYPGENGSAVIAGHYNGTIGENGVFVNLNELKKGDKVYINYANGINLTYLVRESRLYDPGFAKDVFGENSGNHLNLVTCDGVWDATKKSYSKRLVVFTDISQ